MATLHLICGLPCAGKTTLARRLERERAALRLTPDAWHTALFGNDLAHPKHDVRHNLIEALLWDLAARARALGTNVILDFGFWAQVEREDYRGRAAALGAASELHFLDVPAPTLLARLAARNASSPVGTFVIPEARLREWIAFFQAPGLDELQRREAVRPVQ